MLISVSIYLLSCNKGDSQITKLDDITPDFTYIIVDTGQDKFYDNSNEISEPSTSDAFYAQDAYYKDYIPNYRNNNDSTITDLNTGLMWQQNPGAKMSLAEAEEYIKTFKLADYDNWRLPTIKELYSLIIFSGIDPSGWEGTNTDLLTPFIDTDYFIFNYGDENAGERIIDAQYLSSTKYVSTTMAGDKTVFGVNFADGRIKGYPYGPMPGQTTDKKFFVMFVRSNTNYGINNFIDNNDETISDNSTGLMWDKNDSEQSMTWEEAFEWIKQKNSENYLGYNDWKLPNVKELQSIVDYTRSPATTNSAAIDPIFNCTKIIDEGGNNNYPFYWSSTTHANMTNGGNAAYVAFGEALGYMNMFETYELMDVHGAGAQRSDPKIGNPEDYPYGHGPQGDVIRIYNFVRCVRKM
ncbi:MAG: DUF1566 domain-containing protein [Bacteroidales bacterium]|nr:DUF1566 domain-containing protein [Bacteroidales bacterium]MBN2758195.1 DUF1566 domain-containing protein [Bacteroidales bacterium]